MLVPDDIEDETHRVLMTRCYKKFTLILAGESSGEESNLRLWKRSSDGNSTWVYPEVCLFCVRKDVSYRRKKLGLEKLEMKEAKLLRKQKARENYFFLRNIAFRLNCKKLLVSWTLPKIFLTKSKKSCNPVSCIFLPK